MTASGGAEDQSASLDSRGPKYESEPSGQPDDGVSLLIRGLPNRQNMYDGKTTC